MKGNTSDQTRCAPGGGCAARPRAHRAGLGERQRAVSPSPSILPHLSFRSPERSSFAACIKKGAPHHDLVRKEPGRLFSPADVFNTTIRNTSTSQRTQPCGQTGTGFASVFSNRRGPDSAGGRPGGTAQQGCREWREAGGANKKRGRDMYPNPSILWRAWRDSNPRPSDSKSDALSS